MPWEATAADVTATNAAGSTTQSSAGHDVGQRPAPTLISTNPASPSTASTPKVKGTSPAAGTGYRIKLYVNDSTCSGPAAAESNVATFQGIGTAVGPLAVGTSQIRATLTDPAGNPSACSAPLSYTRTGGGPAPTLISTNPASPSTASTPKVKGTSPAAGTGYRIKLYVNDSTCSGPAAAESNVATFQGIGTAVGPLAVGTSQIRATLTDPAGNPSACSAPLSYTRTGTPAPTLISTNPASPSTASTPKVKGTSPAAGTGYRIKLYVNDSTCSGPAAAESNVATFQGIGTAVGPLAVGTSQIRATLTDPAGNPSACSAPLSYTRLG